MKFISILLLMTIISCQSSIENGIDQIDSILPKLKGKRVGIVANQTSINKNKEHLITILETNHIDLKTIFSPEHGLKGDLADGAIYQSDDTKFFSLYGSTRKPTPEIMEQLDVVIYDMQDVGSRYYTYISTMGLVMQACAETQTDLIILDRKNYLGRKSHGFLLRDSLRSFIGMYPILNSYGLTPGELAKAIKSERWLENLDHLNLDIVKVRNWDGEYIFEDHEFTPTSPNIPTVETLFLYSGLCLIEGTNLSEGRGTDNAFKWIGAPWLNVDEIMSKFKYEGISLKKISYTPVTIQGKAWKPKFENEECHGLEFAITDYEKFDALEFTIRLIHEIAIQHDEFSIDRPQYFNWLLGIDDLTNQNVKDASFIETLLELKKKQTQEFQDLIKRYYFYQ